MPSTFALRLLLSVLVLVESTSSFSPETSPPIQSERSSTMLSRYEAAVRKLYQVNMWNPVKLGLENSETLHRLVGSPMKRLPVIHIAGTNGKGSVAWKVSRALREAGYRDALFVSPHVASFRERIQVNGELISEEAVATNLPWLFDLCKEHDVPSTFFELATALAFHHFGESNADVVVLETGLGGRLDATNVVPSPVLSVITSIGLDHTRILGDTLEKIALEKAGIMKPQRPVLVGDSAPHSVLREAATKVGSPYHTVSEVLGEEYEVSQIQQKRIGDILTSSPLQSPSPTHTVVADFDFENSRIARATLKLFAESDVGRSRFPGVLNRVSLERGLDSRPPCRFEKVIVSAADASDSLESSTKGDAMLSRSSWERHIFPHDTSVANARIAPSMLSGDKTLCEVILDVGHNPPALAHLLAKLRTQYADRRWRFVIGLSRDKDLDECTAMLLRGASFYSPGSNLAHVYFVRAGHPRAAPPTMLEESARVAANAEVSDESETFIRPSSYDEIFSTFDGDQSVTKGVNAAVAAAIRNSNHKDERGEVVIVCGSVFIMAEAREALGFEEPRDSPAILEVAGSHLKSTEEHFADEKIRLKKLEDEKEKQ